MTQSTSQETRPSAGGGPLFVAGLAVLAGLVATLCLWTGLRRLEGNLAQSRQDATVLSVTVQLQSDLQAQRSDIEGLEQQAFSNAAESLGLDTRDFVVEVDGVVVERAGSIAAGTEQHQVAVFEHGGSSWVIFAGPASQQLSRFWSTLAGFVGAVLSLTSGGTLVRAQRNGRDVGRQEQSAFEAVNDELTGLLNRAGITRDLNMAIANGSRTSLPGILFLDLDRFKIINDSIGHSAGDEVLSVVASRISATIRDSDSLGRFGGDEFVVVSHKAKSVNDLTRLAERIIESLMTPAALSDETTQMLSASIGISYASDEDATAEDLLRDADLAMYRAKEAGGSQYVVFDAEFRAEALARLEVERDLRQAIRTGQLVVHYQPIVDLNTGAVDRVEALVRWQHPVKGMIPPGAFLSVAAESGLIVDVGEHVLREACRQAALWSEVVGEAVMVSVNVAERQLIDAGLVDTVARVLEETGIPPSQLELELTEELIVERLDHRLTSLHQLVEMGVKLAIDDFGTSRASLGQLKKLDMVSTLKIDRAFVIDIATDSVDRKIVTAIVALADSVGMEVVAEGVEDRDQVLVLQELGVTRIQGFYFQRPAPSEQMTTILTRKFEIPKKLDSLVGDRL